MPKKEIPPPEHGHQIFDEPSGDIAGLVWLSRGKHGGKFNAHLLTNGDVYLNVSPIHFRMTKDKIRELRGDMDRFFDAIEAHHPVK